MAIPTGGVGSNQYQTKPGGGRVEVRSATAALALSVTDPEPDPDPEAVAWAFQDPNPDRAKDRYEAVRSAILDSLSDHTLEIAGVVDPSLERGADDECYRMVTLVVRPGEEADRATLGGDDLIVEFELKIDSPMFKHLTMDGDDIHRAALSATAAMLINVAPSGGSDLTFDEEDSVAGWKSPQDWQFSLPFDDAEGHAAAWTLWAPRPVWERVWQERQQKKSG